MSNEISVYDRMENPVQAISVLGEAIAKSGMFGCDKLEQGIILALQCIAERKAPLEMAKNYHIIGGKLSMRSDAMLAEYRKRGGKVIWKDFSEKLARAIWIYDGNEIELSYSIEEAKAAGLVRAGSGWVKDPAAMLRARLISKAIRMLAPEVCTGVYTPEEVESFTPPTQRMTAIDPTNQACTVKELQLIDVDPLQELLESYEPHATALFIAQEWIMDGQKFTDCSEEKRKNILKNPKPLLEKLRNLQDETK